MSNTVSFQFNLNMEPIIDIPPRAQTYIPPAPQNHPSTLVVRPIPIVEHRVARKPINDQVDWRKSGF